MTHLGERVSDLVDGQLPPEAIERAHAHLANCRECRDAVEAERLMKARLRCLPSPAPGGDLISRLLALGGPDGPLPPRPGHVPGSPRPELVVLSAAERDQSAAVSVPRSYEWPPYELAERDEATASSRGGGTLLAVGPGRPGVSRLLNPRPGAGRPSGRAEGRSGGRDGRGRGSPVGAVAGGTSVRWVNRRRARLAGAVLGALGVVGAGVGGLVLVGPTPGATAPATAPLDSFVMTRAVPSHGPVTPGVSLRLRPGHTATSDRADSVEQGR